MSRFTASERISLGAFFRLICSALWLEVEAAVKPATKKKCGGVAEVDGGSLVLYFS